MTADERLVLQGLTRNAVLTLDRHAGRCSTGPCLLEETYTGTGKWTYLAMLGVRSNLRKNGCIEAIDGGLDRITPLGARLALVIAADLGGAVSACRQPA